MITRTIRHIEDRASPSLALPCSSVLLIFLLRIVPLKQPYFQKTDENLAFDEQILSAAKSITAAVQTLVKAASSAQRELIAQGELTITALIRDFAVYVGLMPRWLKA